MNHMRMVANVLSMCEEISWMPKCVILQVMCMRVCGVCAMLKWLFLFLSPMPIFSLLLIFDLTDIDFQVLKQKCVSVLYPRLMWL